MVEFSVLQLALVALLYWLILWPIGNYSVFKMTSVASLFVGIILGDIPKALMIGAFAQPMFMAFTNAGGTIVWDQTAGVVLGCVIGIGSNLPIEQSLLICVPASLLFAQLGTLTRIVLAWPASIADKAALKGDGRKINFAASWLSYLIKFFLYGVPMFIVLLIGAEPVGNAITNMPLWLQNAMDAVGGMLPAVGMALLIFIIGRKEFIPFFLAAFFLVQYAGISGMALALCGGFCAFVYYLILRNTNKNEETEEAVVEDATEKKKQKRIFSPKEIWKLTVRWWWLMGQSNSFARLDSLSYCASVEPAMKKLYKEGTPEYKDALTRHLVFFNTNGIPGAVIPGVNLAMEEQYVEGRPVDLEAVTNLKVGLMGPLAGLGDSLFPGSLLPLAVMLWLPLCGEGNILGPIGLAITSCTIVLGCMWFFYRQGYELGMGAASSLLAGSKMKTLIAVAGVLGMFMVGGISASMVSLTTPIYIPGSRPFSLQTGFFDKIVPGLLSLALIFGLYKYRAKGGSIMKAVLFVTIVGFILAAIGVFGAGGLIFSAIPAA